MAGEDWPATYRILSGAEQADDLVRFAEAAFLVGEDEQSVAAWSRGVVSREDLLGALTPQDEASAARVSKLLCDNLGARPWGRTGRDRAGDVRSGARSVVVPPCASPA